MIDVKIGQHDGGSIYEELVGQKILTRNMSRKFLMKLFVSVVCMCVPVCVCMCVFVSIRVCVCVCVLATACR